MRRVAWAVGALWVLASCDGDPAALDAGGDAALECMSLGEPCEEPGARTCGDEGPTECTMLGECLAWRPLDACGGASFCVDGACAPCDGPGSFSDATLDVGGAARTYFLHVPDGLACGEAAPLWLDFHGTATNRPEVAYNLDDQLAIADREGIIVARPRSRARSSGGFDVYQWDASPGDLEANAAFARALVRDVRSRYRIDPGRVYASGFSSGTNMVAQLMGPEGPPFTGYGFVAGGAWTSPALRDFAEAPARVYGVTGYRDYIHPSWRQLRSTLEDAGFPAAALFEREADAGHDQYGWHLEEMWAWLDRGARREAPDGAGWAPVDGADATGASWLSVARAADGSLVVGGTEGAILRRDAAGVWSRGELGAAIDVTGLCLDADGRGVAAGSGMLGWTDDAGATFRIESTPSGFPGAMVVPPFLTAAACPGGAERFVAGYWLGLRSADGGESFDAVEMPGGFGASAQVSAAAASPSTGTVVAAGYFDYVGRLALGEASFSRSAAPATRGWHHDVSVSPDGAFWVVGAGGAAQVSVDDGLSWQDRSVDSEEDLYAVAAGPGGRVVAAGAHGAVFASADSGQSWTALPTGLDGFVGDVVFLEDGVVLLVGEDGLLRTRAFD